MTVLGDSQTYGAGVESQDAWPRQLKSMTANTVYSMAYGGYGPVHSLMLWDEAVALEPRIIIEAFYAGNDLFDSFNLVYNRKQFPELRSSDALLQESVREAERSEPIGKRVVQMFRMGATNEGTRKSQLLPTPKTFSPRSFISQHSKLYGLLRRVRYELTRIRTRPKKIPQEEWANAKAFAEAHSAYCQVFDNGKFKTIFTSEYRLSALDMKDPRIAEGHQISLNAIRRMNELAGNRSIQFVVVLIPTKELVFRELWSNPPMSYRTLTENEEFFWKITKGFLEDNGIEYLDALPALREQLTTGFQPYKVSPDGHPNKRGHMAIANLVSTHL